VLCASAILELTSIKTITATLIPEWFAKIVDGTKRLDKRGNQTPLDQTASRGVGSVPVGAQKWHVAAGSGGDGPDRSGGAKRLETEETERELSFTHRRVLKVEHWDRVKKKPK
jgi:hypothetical protein